METKKTKVLMLDDEKFLLYLYKIAFEKNGYEVSTFNDADDALKALRGGYSPDVILFDITMPDSKSGYEFIETVKDERLAPRCLKIALTNEGQDEEKVRMGQLGADAHFLKAKYTPSQVAVAVTQILTEIGG